MAGPEASRRSLAARALAAVYRVVVDVVGGLSKPKTLDEMLVVSEATRSEFAGQNFRAVDAAATFRGEVFRGLGIIASALGALAVWLAVSPMAFQLSQRAAAVTKTAKLATLALLGGLLLYAHFGNLKRCWIEARLLAEELRYSVLAAAIRSCRSAPSGGELAPLQALHDELVRLLFGGEGCQILYHQRRLSGYLLIEQLVNKVTYGGLALSVLGSLLAFVIRSSGLLVLTVLVPMGVAAIHGMSSFLRLPQLIAQHEGMIERLRRIRDLTPAADELPEQGGLLVDLADELILELQRGDSAWTGIAKGQEPAPV